MSSIDQQFVEYIVKSLVNSPDKVQVERTIDEKGVLLSLTDDQEDLGRVIGKRGSTAQSIRTLLRALGTKNDARYNLKIIDPEGGRPPRRDDGDERPLDDKPADVKAAEDDGTVADDKPASDDKKPTSGKQPTKESVVPEVEETPAEETPTEESKDSLADKTRKELAELDDLDI
jgi:hypothetical protein